MATPQDRRVSARGLMFHYVEWGKAAQPPLLCLHGITQTAHSWDEVASDLSSDHRVLCFDQRGHGDSDWAPDGDYTRQTQAADFDAITDALGLHQFMEAFAKRAIADDGETHSFARGGVGAMETSKRPNEGRLILHIRQSSHSSDQPQPRVIERRAVDGEPGVNRNEPLRVHPVVDLRAASTGSRWAAGVRPSGGAFSSRASC